MSSAFSSAPIARLSADRAARSSASTLTGRGDWLGAQRGS
jgi:hypothetical protein